ncbi:MAG: hypothetical protein JHC95_19575 [Solirubrobacteraceae bacterium]|nr:hypothetical protein [Solirubrobacteraceae bacterium]
MSSRVLHPPYARLLSVLALAAALLVALALPSFADAAKKKAKKVSFPTVTSVSPKKARIGQQITIRGAGYLAGKGKTTVAFKRDGKKALMVKADMSTKKMIKITVPGALATQLSLASGFPVSTRFRLRVIAKRFGKRYTPLKLSPEIGPERSSAVDVEECSKARSGTDPLGDLDKDFLTNAEEIGLRNKLDPCNEDTDGDSMTDGWEYFAAKDLNIRAVPFPGKKPFPNALDGTDAKWDYDGDGLYAYQEFSLWKTYGRPSQVMENRDQLLYSDGTKNSGGPGPNQLADLATLQANDPACGNTFVPPSFGYLGDGYVTGAPVEDDEKDADHDGLGNWSEANGTMTQKWWQDVYPNETPYDLRNFTDTDLNDPDTDGDGCVDGLDDQDADDWPNWTESGAHSTTWTDGVTQWAFGFGPIGLAGNLIPAWDGWADAVGNGTVPFAAHAFNPCLPDADSRTCRKYVKPGNGVPPQASPGYIIPSVSNPGDPIPCRILITLRSRTMAVWVWDSVKKAPWASPTPPAGYTCIDM